MSRKLHARIHREFESVRQLAQEVLGMLTGPKPGDSPSPSTRAPTFASYFTASDWFNDQESGICLEDSSSQKFTPSGLNFVQMLPPELLLIMISYLDVEDLVSCFQVSKSWNQVLNSPAVWRLLFQSDFDNEQPSCTCDYKLLYKNNYVIRTNWRNYKFKTYTLDGHEDSVYCAKLLGDWVFTGSRDNTIRVWNRETAECLRVIQDNSASVLCLAVDEELLISGSSDSTCHVYSLPSFQCIHVLKGHNAHILDVNLTEKYILSCSKDGSVTVWDRYTGEMVWKISTAHRSAVNAMGVLGDMLFTAGGDGLIRQWDLQDGRCVRKLRGHTRGLACLQVDEKRNRLISGGNDRTVRIWDIATGECTISIPGHQHLVRSLHLMGSDIISASYDRTIRVWNSSGELIAKYHGLHGSWIFCVCGNTKYLVSTSVGTKPVILDFTSGLDHNALKCVS